MYISRSRNHILIIGYLILYIHVFQDHLNGKKKEKTGIEVVY